ncbi:gem-associated protein 2-like [Senna tora]|uniref:Gem-associated protein 2 n=1 Tax=Senna tora TaxID=362788 RepID=A0A834SPJ7_9FABA|nr:gem-associated protein 2-like [Senna tora]
MRWEAAQIPKVKVAKVDRSKLNKEQSAYIPKIPDIVKCPEHLLPMEQWEDVFLADFSELRALTTAVQENLSQLLGSSVEHSRSSQSIHLPPLPRKPINQPILTAESKDTSASPSSDVSVGESSSNLPLLSTILGMDSVSRVSMLQKRIFVVETADTITRNDYMWLFALCATVDTPLDADTCAALRTLLRKCASLRATKTQLDDQVVMLNILVAISGRYFGQAEN